MKIVIISGYLKDYDWNIENISKELLLSPMFAWNKLYKKNILKKKIIDIH